jgi:L-seryl-tRNA(Ser) seleniumtransferase
MTRALRIDKLTLAVLESTLRLYREEEKACRVIPTLRMILLPFEKVQRKAKKFADRLKRLSDSRIKVRLIERSSRAGGGALPLLELPSLCIGVQVRGMSANALEKTMRENDPPIIGRIEEDLFIMDPRTIQEDELPLIETAFENMLKRA